MRVYDYVPDGTTIEIKMKVWTGYAGADLDTNAKFSKFSFKVGRLVKGENKSRHIRYLF